jgi:hypothetical protein
LVQRDDPPPDALTVSNLEDELDSALFRSHGQNDLWQLAADLARRNVQPQLLESHLPRPWMPAPAPRSSHPNFLLDRNRQPSEKEIESSTSRISDLVLAIKE